MNNEQHNPQTAGTRPAACPAAGNDSAVIAQATTGDYKYGFSSDIDTEIIPPGLSEDVVRLISEKKKEPQWLLDFRLEAFRYWKP